MNPFQSLRDYEEFVYTLPQQFTAIVSCTLVVARRGALVVITTGEIHFSKGYRLTVKERLSLENGPLVLERYGCEVWRGEEKLYWYDSQPHPHDSAVASTDPHHKHIAPDIKHHRVPAPQLSFTRPNLPALIEEIQSLAHAA